MNQVPDASHEMLDFLAQAASATLWDHCKNDYLNSDKMSDSAHDCSSGTKIL